MSFSFSFAFAFAFLCFSFLSFLPSWMVRWATNLKFFGCGGGLYMFGFGMMLSLKSKQGGANTINTTIKTNEVEVNARGCRRRLGES
ncbi:hypothetical protein BCR34DRAFT_563927 [Clohesyomyces aquaticus]|uniref:Uncharacterized protein n=1 Tax=Clohesyomyces aquaticus TaxID=1231657 RepID=A0A1Y1ZPZ4_9PLEO|nr:hypothetical protein BCR34DRAFT_563927 [Clohesyomyces aquaticus]